MDQQNINAYIPLSGGALIGSEGFRYDEQRDCYICLNNKILKGSGRIVDDGKGPVRKYFSLKTDCEVCPLRSNCISAKAKTKKVQHSYYRLLLDEAKERATCAKGQSMKRRQSATVEPVWGTLINFTGIKRIDPRGLSAANKCLILAATCYNLKKWMKHILKASNQNLQALSKQAEIAFKNGSNTLSALIKACLSLLKVYGLVLQ